MKRRTFIAGLGSAAAWPLVARAQQQSALPIVGFVQSGSFFASWSNAFRRGLNETGYVEGQNVTVEYNWLNGEFDRLPALMADLARRRVAVIATPGSNYAAQAAKAATATIPIVFSVGQDPVNVPNAETALRDIPEAARAIGLQTTVLNASTSREIEAAFATLVRDRADALFVNADVFFATQSVQFATLAAHYGIPAAYDNRAYAEVGGLMSYGTDVSDTFRQVGVYTGQILKGAKPADLPVLQSTKFEFVINLQTARALGIEVPNSLLLVADETIE